MKIWIVVTDDDNGTDATAYVKEHEAGQAAMQWVETYRPYYEDMPNDDFEVAYNWLLEQTGFIDTCAIIEQELAFTPYEADS